MSDNTFIGSVVFGNWKVKELIEDGSLRGTYIIEREEYGNTYIAGMKIISIPSSSAELEEIRRISKDEESVHAYFKNLVVKLVNEITSTDKLNGDNNAVGYKDHLVVEKKNEIGWDIYIRMELLTPMNTSSFIIPNPPPQTMIKATKEENNQSTLPKMKENVFAKFNKYNPIIKTIIIIPSVISILFIMLIVYAIVSPNATNSSTSSNQNLQGKKIVTPTVDPVPAVIPAAAPTPAATPAPAVVKPATPAATPTPEAKPAATAQVKNGFYKVTDANGATYEGNYVNDKKQGKGTLMQADGIKVVGDFLDNKITGKEVVYFTNGDRYEGAMVDGKRDGSGKFIYAAGGYYDGVWKANVKTGYGVFQYTNGDIYQGNFVNGLPDDTLGKMKFKNGTSYEGAFIAGNMTGQGTRYYSNGIYRGAFVAGVLEGYGIYEWESGNTYKGYFKSGKRNGQGTLYYQNGGIDFGTWKDDILVVKG